MLSTEKAYPIDITSFREHGAELRKAIEESVKSTQSVIIRTLPDKIIMTERQYNELSPNFLPMDVEGQSYYLYRTPLNVMEIEVVDRKDDGVRIEMKELTDD